ncbi:hypothetical protein Tco_0097135 [Tanacetum coccineum]
MNETTIHPLAAITSAKVAVDLSLILITGIAITIVAVVLNPWLGCSKKHLCSPFKANDNVTFVFLEDGSVVSHAALAEAVPFEKVTPCGVVRFLKIEFFGYETIDVMYRIEFFNQGILVLGKLKCRIRVTSLAVFTLRISVVSSGRCAPVMMLPWLHFGSLRVGTVAAVRTCRCALFFPPNLLNTPPVLSERHCNWVMAFRSAYFNASFLALSGRLASWIPSSAALRDFLDFFRIYHRRVGVPLLR